MAELKITNPKEIEMIEQMRKCVSLNFFDNLNMLLKYGMFRDIENGQVVIPIRKYKFLKPTRTHN